MNQSETNTDSQACDWYAPDPDRYDESRTPDGVLKPHWNYFIKSLQQLGCDEMERRREQGAQFLRENGVTYNVYGDPDGLNRPWELDPLPFLIASEEWAAIEAGLIQRAELLNLILADLYGPRELIRKGLLPLELIYNHHGFQRPCDQVLLAGAHQLIIYAAEMARGPDGRMWILNDRTQAPSGAGYALENRMAMTHILPSLFRDSHVHRHAMFFRALRSSLAAIAPVNKDDPSIVVLTPGPHNETYFEHAYLSAYLGYNLVQGNDLTVRDGRVWLKALDGLKPVDVILRRVDDDYCDPLELRGDSQLGVAGLLEVARRGNVAIANPLGSGVLENPALMAFLPAIAQHFLGQDLSLPSVATWWCGQTNEREHVLKNLDKLVIKPIHRHRNSRPLFGPNLSRKELESLRVRIRAHPYLYAGQELVSFSTIPALINGKAEPRHAVMRSFLAAREDGYVVMPGGLTRTALDKDGVDVSNQAGGISKDTWVLASEPERHVSLWQQPDVGSTISARRNIVPSRMADNLFWVGRYCERAEMICRFLRTVLRKWIEVQEFGDEDDSICLQHLLRALTHLTGSYPGFVGEGADELLARPEQELASLTLDRARLGSLPATLRSLVQTAYAARDLWSSDTWRLMDELERTLSTKSTRTRNDISIQLDHLDQLVTALMAFSGLSAESMLREQGWHFLDIGRRIERGLLTSTLLRSLLVTSYPQEIEHKLLEAALITHESLIAYRRRYRSFLQLPGTLELLFLDASNPRAVLYQLDRLQEHISALPRDNKRTQLSAEERLVLEATTQMRITDAQSLATLEAGETLYKELDQRLARTSHLISRISEVLADSYFSHTQGPQQLTPVQPELEP